MSLIFPNFQRLENHLTRKTSVQSSAPMVPTTRYPSAVTDEPSMRQYDAKRQNHPQIIKTARSVFRLGQALGERLIKDLHPISPMVTFCKRDHSPFWVGVQR